MHEIFNDPSNIYMVGSKPFLKLEFLRYLLHKNLIVEGVQGGLILGNFHSEGGIPVIQNRHVNEYEIIAEVEGCEYFMNPFLTREELNEVENINKMHGTQEINRYSVPSNIKLINAQGNAVILLGKGSQFVVNKYATFKNLEFLDELNKNSWSERVNP